MKKKPAVIAVTDNMGPEHKLQQYLRWLQSDGTNVECAVLSYEHDDGSALEQCGGLVLTGGGDVDPALYGGQAGHPNIYSLDRKRDDFERTLIDRALKAKIPILGICRGFQLANVHYGGSLFEDLSENGFPDHETEKENERRHEVNVEPGSELARMTGKVAGEVNSYHHQGINKPGQNLRVVSRSKDGLPEALELIESSTNNFFLLVQWHPERMQDTENPFTQKILRSFLSSIIEKTKE